MKMRKKTPEPVDPGNQEQYRNITDYQAWKDNIMCCRIKGDKPLDRNPYGTWPGLMSFKTR